MPEQIRRLADMLEANDIRAAGSQAHAIKGAAANVGGDLLHRVALAIEEAATAGDLQVASDQMFQLRRAFDHMKLATTETHRQPEGQMT